MAVYFSNSSQIFSGPRVIETKDGRAGCPPTAAQGSTLISQTFTISQPCVFWTHARIIFFGPNAGGSRADIYLKYGTSVLKASLNSILNSNGTVPGNWEELNATYMGTLSAGTHTLYITGENGSNCWGCESNWGQMTTLVWAAS